MLRKPSKKDLDLKRITSLIHALNAQEIGRTLLGAALKFGFNPSGTIQFLLEGGFSSEKYAPFAAEGFTPESLTKEYSWLLSERQILASMKLCEECGERYVYARRDPIKSCEAAECKKAAAKKRRAVRYATETPEQRKARLKRDRLNRTYC